MLQSRRHVTTRVNAKLLKRCKDTISLSDIKIIFDDKKLQDSPNILQKLDGLGSHKKNPLFILMMDKINAFESKRQQILEKLLI